MTKKVFLIIAFVLFIAGVAGWIYALMIRSTLVQRDQEIADLSMLSTAKDSDWSKAQVQLQTTSTARGYEWSTAQAQLQTTSSAQQASLQTATEAFSVVTRHVGTQAAQLAGLRELYGDQLIQIADLEEIGVCERRPSSIDYTSNSTVSASLKQWLEDTEGSIDKADWDVIWSNGLAAIHKLTGEYLWMYVVYLDDPEWNLSERVFDVRHHCFLDP